MTTEIEKQFFDTFGIEPKKVSFCGIRRCVYQHPSNCTKEECPFYAKDKIRYPQISDRILLELIRVYAGAFGSFVIHRFKNLEELKHIILSEMIAENTSIKYRVQKLFKED